MLKMTLKSLSITGLLVIASVAVAALATRRPAAEAPTPAYCKEGGNWLAVSTTTPRPATVQEIVANAVRQDVVLLGEQHDLEDHHRWQLQMLSALHAQRPNMVIGFEMFPRRTQPVLDQWVAGSLSSREFLKQAEWDKVWNFPPQIYMPLFEFARINKIPMRALNVDRNLTHLIAEKGWENVPEDAREGVGRPAPALPAYLDFLREVYRMHAEVSGTLAGKTAPSADAGFKGFVDSQLAWDRAMAEALSRAVSPAGSKNPALVVGIMGSGHIRYGHGVPHQLGNLGVSKVASLLPVSLEAECRQLDAGLATAVFILPSKPMPPSEPPRLGVVLEDEAQGLKIRAVTAGSLAEKTGLRVGDRIVEISGRPAGGSSDAVATIRRQPPGTWLPLRIARGDSHVDLVVQFPPRPEP
jgi:uncharacterized iron-regulated protein